MRRVAAGRGTAFGMLSGLGYSSKWTVAVTPGHAAHYPRCVAMAGQVFSKVDISGPKAVHRTIGKPNFPFPGTE